MTQEKQYYRVACMDGSCMGFTSSKPDLLEALERCIKADVTQDDIDFGYAVINNACGEVL